MKESCNFELAHLNEEVEIKKEEKHFGNLLVLYFWDDFSCHSVLLVK